MSVRCLAVLALVGACGDEPSGQPDWMAPLDGTRTIAELSIPGSHDSGAMFDLYEGADVAKTQTLTIAEQLTAGVRYFDVRCRHLQDQFLIFHGAVDQNQTFDEVLATMSEFLAAHPGETILASVKEESVPTNNTRSFEETFATYASAAPWVFAPTLPRLDDVRGKLVLLRRFDAASTPLGIDATAWPDNTVFSIDNADAHLRIEDAYKVTDNDAKWAAITGLLDEAAAGDPATWMLTYTSGYQTMNELPIITVVSDDINARFDARLAQAASAPTHLGTLAMDFVTEDRVAAIIATNR